MKLLIVNKLYRPWIGGIETVVEELAEGLLAADIETTVLCCQPKGQGSETMEKGVSVIKASSLGMFMKMPVSFSFFKEFKKRVETADVIDLHHPFPLGFLAWYLFRPRTRLIVHYHADIVRQKISAWLLAPIFKKVLDNASSIVVSNPGMINASPLLKKYAAKCQVVPFGIDVDGLIKNVDQNAVATIKESYGKFILFVGRLSRYKGISALLEAMKKNKYPLVIIGHGEEESTVKNFVKTNELEGRVFFLPPQSEKELANYFAAAALFVLPSITKAEAFGLVLLTAMALGKPIVTTELGTGTSFVNQNGVTGLVVPPGDSGALADAIHKIMEDEAAAKSFGAAGAERARSEFSLETMLAKTKALLA